MDRRVDVAAIEELLRERAWLERLVAGLAASPADRDDLAQRTIVHALAAPARIRDPRAYLAKVARGFALNLGRERSRRALRERAAAPLELATDFDPSLLAERAEMHRRVIAALLELDDPQRSILLLRFHGEETSEAIAARLSMPAPTVRSHLRRGLERLRARLDGDSACRDWRRLLVPSLGWRAGAGASGLLVGGVLVTWKIVSVASLVAVAAALGVFGSNSDLVPRSNDGSLPATVLAPPAVDSAGPGIAERHVVERTIDSNEEKTEVSAAIRGPRASVRGRVVWESTLVPVSGVSIAMPPESRPNSSPVEVARTAGDGSFFLADVAATKKLRLRYAREGGFPSYRDVVFPSAGEHHLELRLEPEVRFAGRVLDGTTREPIADARLRIDASSALEGEPRFVDCVSDETGGFEFAAPSSRADRLRVIARSAGYTTTRVAVRGSDFSVPMLRSARIEGRVFTADRSIAAHASFEVTNPILDVGSLPAGHAWNDDCEVLPSLDRCEADAFGKFVIDAAPPWSDFVLFGIQTSTGLVVRRPMRTGASATTTVVEITLPRTAGTAVLEGTLSVNGRPAPLEYRLNLDGRAIGGDWKAGHDGRYRHEGLPGGQVRLDVSVPGVETITRRVEIREGAATALDVDAVVTTSWIGGRVIDSDGSPAVNAGVTIRARNRDWRVGIHTGANGEFRVLSALAAGEDAIVRVLREGWFHEEAIVGGEEHAELVLPEVARVRLRIVDRETSAPLRNPAIRIVDPAGQRRELMGDGVRVLPDDVIELRLGSGRHVLEIDRSRNFYSCAEMIVEATATPGLTLVEVPPAITGTLRIEFDPDAKIEMPKLARSHLWKTSGTDEELRAIPLTAIRFAQLAFLEFELPVGTIDFGVYRADTEKSIVLVSSLAIRRDETTKVRMRREE